MQYTKDFSRKTLKQLAAKDIAIAGSQAIPAYDGDKYYGGVAYQLTYNKPYSITTHNTTHYAIGI